ncbi:BFH_collapsed_G0040960.mRNA.1.CDS.1 [Saccharomyces cerevisiae]|nr:BFH_collapsed_G0040960.mRNA.1.CDS.1 [Saccharomyces cerevisiae]
MARSRGSSRPISRSRPTQTRSASTMAAPVHPQQQQQQQQPKAYSHPPAAGAQTRQPGMFAQMASTAAGVAVGSTIGHTLGAGITGMFSGSGSDSAPVEQQQQNIANTSGQTQTDQQLGRTCEIDARNFTRCLDENNGNFQICDYYLQQLKACQEAARQY